MKKLIVSKGSEVIVDDEDFEFLSQWKWKLAGAGYAARTTRSGMLYMHRLLASATGNICGVDVDHINGNKLDNRKYNLRAVTKSENQRGYRKPQRGSTGYRGVTLYKRTGKWSARIKIEGKNLFLGYFDSIEQAAEARRTAEKKYW